MTDTTLTKIDYQNLVNIVGRATASGVQEASALLILFQKLNVLAQPDTEVTEKRRPGRPKKEVETDGGDGSTGS